MEKGRQTFRRDIWTKNCAQIVHWWRVHQFLGNPTNCTGLLHVSQKETNGASATQPSPFSHPLCSHYQKYAVSRGPDHLQVWFLWTRLKMSEHWPLAFEHVKKQPQCFLDRLEPHGSRSGCGINPLADRWMRGYSTCSDTIKQDEKDEHNLPLWCKVKLENVLSSDSQTNSKTNFDLCLHTRSHTHKKCRSNQKMALDWALSNPPTLASPNEGNVTTPNSNLQMNGAWLKVYCRRPVICLSAVYTLATTCIFQVTQKVANWRLWVSL